MEYDFWIGLFVFIHFLDTGESSEGSNPQTCTVLPQVADRRSPLERADRGPYWVTCSLHTEDLFCRFQKEVDTKDTIKYS